jgi:hypothetical protein
MSALQVMVSSDPKDDDFVVRRWHDTPSSVLIMTHDKFRDRGEQRELLWQAPRIFCCLGLQAG